MHFEVNHNKAIQSALGAKRRGGIAHSLYTPLAEDSPAAEQLDFQDLLGGNVQPPAATTATTPLVHDAGARVSISDIPDTSADADIQVSKLKSKRHHHDEDVINTDPTAAALDLAQAQQVASTVQPTRDSGVLPGNTSTHPVVASNSVLPKNRSDRVAPAQGDSMRQWLTTGQSAPQTRDVAQGTRSRTEPLFPEVPPVSQLPPPVSRTKGTPELTQPVVVLTTAGPAPQPQAPLVQPDDLPVKPGPLLQRVVRSDSPEEGNWTNRLTGDDSHHHDRDAVAVNRRVSPDHSTNDGLPVKGKGLKTEAVQGLPGASGQPLPVPLVTTSTSPGPTSAPLLTTSTQPTGPDPRLINGADGLLPVKPVVAPLVFDQTELAPVTPVPQVITSVTPSSRPDDDKPQQIVIDNPARLASLPPLQVVNMVNDGAQVTLPAVPSVVDRWINVIGPTVQPDAPKTLQINLAPPDLGQMTIVVSTDAQQRMSVEMSVGTPMAKAALDSQVMAIRQVIGLNQFQVGEVTTQVVPSSQLDSNRIASARGSSGGKDAGSQGAGDGPQRRRPRRRQGDDNLTVGSY